jgi:hypothetical protein
VTTTPTQFEDEAAPVWFAVAAVVSLVTIAFGTWAAVEWWQDAGHFHPSYVLYVKARRGSPDVLTEIPHPWVGVSGAESVSVLVAR